MSRDAALAALFIKLQAIPGLVTVSRRLRMWSDVDPSEQPALFLAGGNHTPTQDPSGIPAYWRQTATLYLYVHTSDPATAPATVLNGLLDAIENAILPVYEEKQTLGGTCEHCWISGQIETDEGVLGDQSVAIIPLEILTA